MDAAAPYRLTIAGAGFSAADPGGFIEIDAAGVSDAPVADFEYLH
ncbi:MAG: hypothetical protein P8X90_01430 [Desulfobacterales bacterium]|jgi:hypothetical protein